MKFNWIKTIGCSFLVLFIAITGTRLMPSFSGLTSLIYGLSILISVIYILMIMTNQTGAKQ